MKTKHTLKAKKPFTAYVNTKSGLVHFPDLFGEDRTLCGEALDELDEEDMFLYEVQTKDYVTCPHCASAIKKLLVFYG